MGIFTYLAGRQVDDNWSSIERARRRKFAHHSQVYTLQTRVKQLERRIDAMLSFGTLDDARRLIEFYRECPSEARWRGEERRDNPLVGDWNETTFYEEGE